jgi:hypothetical protein
LSTDRLISFPWNERDWADRLLSFSVAHGQMCFSATGGLMSLSLNERDLADGLVMLLNI